MVALELNSQTPGGHRRSFSDSASPEIIPSPHSLVTSTDKSNALCADCGKENPEWASINFGTIICIDCSGFHRALGVHISKVRSLLLDKWDELLVDVPLLILINSAGFAASEQRHRKFVLGKESGNVEKAQPQIGSRGS